jgi:hypothetical protein
MLGHHPILRRQLEKKGLRAPAKVREAKRLPWSETTGNMPAAELANQKNLWELVLVVEPESEQPFEARVQELLSWSEDVEPSERHDQFVVLYDPSDHSKVVIDHSDEADRMLAVDRLKEQTDAQVSLMRDRGQGFWADRYQAAQESLAAYMSEDHSNLSADQREDALHAQQQKMREIMAGDSMQRAEQIQQIQRDPSIPPEQKRAKIMELMAGMGIQVPSAMVAGQPAPMGGSSGSATFGGSSDPGKTADALSKLADLRDRGVLTDDEFQAQKKKLLGA